MGVFPLKVSRTIQGHKALREALRDTHTYSSDLIGDADVRDYQQLPLEVDPPRHHLYRSALAPYFVKPAIEPHLDKFKINTHSLISDYFKQAPTDVTKNISLPLVMRNLGVVYNRPQDVSEWISWGPDVWTAESKERSGAVLHRYLDRIYKEAITKKSEDIWRDIAFLEIDGEQITEIEFKGIASVLLAGGRDTVIKLMTGMLWHFARAPEDLHALRKQPGGVPAAIQEFLRFLSPLPTMNRTTTPESGQRDLPSDRYIGMSFISANFDGSVFEDPFTLNLQRSRNPHLSFGFGPHTCIGNHVAEIEAKAFLETLIDLPFTWKIAAEDTKYHDSPFELVPKNFNLLNLQMEK